MVQAERDPVIVDMEQIAHVGLGTWASSHEDDIIKILPYDPDNPYQQIDQVELEAHPSLENARLYGEAGMGQENYDQLVSDFQSNGIVDTVINNAKKNQSTLIASLHLPNTLDTPLTHNALFVSSGDPEFAEINVLLSNFIMSRMSLGGIAVEQIMASSGRRIRALPEAAKLYIAPRTVEYMGRLAIPVLTRTLRQGVALHRALTGTRSKPIILRDGTPAQMIPRIEDSVAKTTVKRTPTIVGVPMEMRFGSTHAHVLPPKRVGKVEEVHRLMHDMVEAVNESATQPVVYGMPPRAQLKDSNPGESTTDN